MAVFRCEMCGGPLEIKNNETVTTCEYCGTQQTLPRLDNERKINLYDRANHFRRNNEYDKAMGIYEQILNEDKSDAKSYWSLVLCRYGIEYVEDTVSHKRVPTVNRAQFTSIFDDDNYKSALRYADARQKPIYENEAKAINEIQKGILKISQKEEPFDVFICYKETDNNGRRTPDSVLANDLYHQLSREGFKVFFSRITLEDKLGSAYEPYIFAALNSAKVMVVLGTKPEYFNAVWVKNEWSRYLALIKNGAQKILIPAYKDMDPYDLPDEFSHLQAQDMSKLGFMQDLIRGINKLVADKESAAKETVIINNEGNTNVTALLDRGFMALEDGEWGKADAFFEQVLNQDARIAQAYLGKMMAELRVREQDKLKDQTEPFDGNKNYQKAIRFADEDLKRTLISCIEHIVNRNTGIKNDAALAEAEANMALNTLVSYKEALELLEPISGWKNADELIFVCREKIYQFEKEEEERKAEQKRLAEITRINAERIEKRNNKIATIVGSIIVGAIVFAIVLNAGIIPNKKYKDAIELMNEGEYQAAIVLFETIGWYEDSVGKIKECNYELGISLIEDGKYQEAITRFETIADYKDSTTKIQESYYLQATELLNNRKYNEAITAYKNVETYKDSQAQIQVSYYLMATDFFNNKKYDEAITAYKNVETYKDSQNQIYKSYYLLGKECLETGEFSKAAISFGNAADYKDAKNQSKALWDKIAVRDTIAAGSNHSVALKSNGTVVATKIYSKSTIDPKEDDYGQSDASGWTDIVAISAGEYHTVGLKSDGTVVAVGDNDEGQCDVANWADIVAISAGEYHTVGLKSDGTVVAVGDNYSGQCDVSEWTDIVAISAGDNHTVGLKSDGTVVAVGDNDTGQCDVANWADIVAISAGDYHTVGLKSDGTVVAVGRGIYGNCDVSEWKDIVSVAAGYDSTIGLKKNGTVVVAGDVESNGSYDSEQPVTDWQNIVAITAGSAHALGLKSNGTVVAGGNNWNGELNVEGWSNIKQPNK